MEIYYLFVDISINFEITFDTQSALQPLEAILLITSKPLLIVQWLIHKRTVADIYYGIVIKKVHKA